MGSPDRGRDVPVADERREPLEHFESWLLRRVAHAVEAGEMPADLLTDLRAEFEAARTRPQGESHVAAVQGLADIAGVAEGEASSALEAIEAQPAVTRALVMRQIAAAWLVEQREAYRRGRGRQ